MITFTDEQLNGFSAQELATLQELADRHQNTRENDTRQIVQRRIDKFLTKEKESLEYTKQLEAGFDRSTTNYY